MYFLDSRVHCSFYLNGGLECRLGQALKSNLEKHVNLLGPPHWILISVGSPTLKTFQHKIQRNKINGLTE